MLSLSFSGGNWENAVETLKRFRKAYSSDRFSIIVGIETNGDRNSELPWSNKATNDVFSEIRNQGWNDFIFWDEQLSQLIFDKNILKDLPKPFYKSFSYGSAVNRMLLLAKYKQCDFMARIDPGTESPQDKDICDLLQPHVDMLNKDPKLIAISGQYEGRLAIRDNNIYCYKKEEYLNFIEKMTGINPKNQVTGGALFTFKVPGIPLIPFEPYNPPDGLTFVWASDDGFLQNLGLAKVCDVTKIPRFDSVGMPKSPNEYFSGVGGMVYLNALMKKNLVEAKKILYDFIVELDNSFLCASLPINKGNVPLSLDFIPTEYLIKIEEGWDNYRQLREQWDEVISTILNDTNVQNLL